MRRQKRREPYSITIDTLSHEGRGIGRIDGKAVFVRGALPGETVLARTVRRRGSFDEAELVEVVEASAARIVPRCRHSDVCGGCSLQHLSADDQIAHKESVLFELLNHRAAAAPRERRPALRGPEWHYRRRARLGVKYVANKGGALIGFREKAAPYIADIEQCLVLHPEVGTRLTELRALINSLSIPDRIPQIEVAAGDDAVALVIRHLAPLSAADLTRLSEFQRSTGIALYLQPGAADTVHPLDPETTPQNYGIDGIRFDFLPTDFTQVNGEMNRKMIEAVIEALEPEATERVLDLYCGLGNFSLPLARRAAHVIGVEANEAAVRRAQANAGSNDIGNATFIGANLDDPAAVRSIDMRGITKMLLDPPRTGAEVVVQELDFSGLDRIVYVSCNPATLARDTKTIVERHGFRLESAGVMDMFPQTSHVESLAIFDRA